MYAFGIVMWEVFTRRDAWHWIDPQYDPRAVIQDRVGAQRLRPKVPVSVSRQCADKVRQCLHEDPGCRPSAKDVGNWLRDQLDGLRKHMRTCDQNVVKESDMLKQKAATTPRGRSPPSSPRQQWSITNRNHEGAEHWNRGMYSPHETTDRDDGSFSLRIAEDYQSYWQERALGAGMSSDVPRSKAPMGPQQFGLNFSELWPTITTIENKTKGETTLGSMFPQIKVGCRITHINDEVCPSTFKAARAMLKARPLTLEFSSPAQAKLVKAWPTQQPALGALDLSAIPPWLKGGLKAVAMVRNHEAVRSGGLGGVALVKSHEERQLQEQLAAAREEIEELTRQLAARLPLSEADPGASRR